MCLGIPGLVEEVLPGGEWVVINTFGLKRKVGIQLVGDVVPGEYLIVHAGYAIEKLDLDEAEERIKLWEEILNGAGAG